MASWAEVHAFSTPLTEGDGESPAPRPGANDAEVMVTPMRAASMLRLTPDGTREIVPARWGWPDRTSPAPPNRPRHMHARGETVHRLPTFRESFERRRGVVPVHTFNVGQEVGKRVVQHVLTPTDGRQLGIAVIWDEIPTPDGGRVVAFVMVTQPPGPVIATVTDREPALLLPAEWGAWLGQNGATAGQARSVLRTHDGPLTMREQPRRSPR